MIQIKCKLPNRSSQPDIVLLNVLQLEPSNKFEFIWMMKHPPNSPEKLHKIIQSVNFLIFQKENWNDYNPYREQFMVSSGVPAFI